VIKLDQPIFIHVHQNISQGVHSGNFPKRGTWNTDRKSPITCSVWLWFRCSKCLYQIATKWPCCRCVSFTLMSRSKSHWRNLPSHPSVFVLISSDVLKL